jgi:phenylpropionate dioxygenase-like ring-hydroxylating dioxygenase large terminal subunit
VTGSLLGSGAYVDQGWLDREVEQLFERTWALVASEDELAVPGAYLEAQVGRTPVVIVRAADGELRGHVNMCRHRGMAMVCGTGELMAAGPGSRVLRCRYHGWEYGCDGSLLRIPQRGAQFSNLDPARLSLHPVRVDTWEGMVFAHLDPAAAPLPQFMGDWARRLGSVRPGRLGQVARARLEGRFNWKLFVENHVDVLHLWYLHDETLADYDHSRFHHSEVGGHWASYEPMRPTAAAADATTAAAGQIRDLEARDRFGIGAHMLFPNILMASTAEFWVTYAVTPLAPDRSVVDLRLRAEPDADPAALVAAARAFIDEDMAACEAVQMVASSARFEVGPLARDHEAPIVNFHQHLVRALGGRP